MVVACVKPIAINYGKFLNSFAPNTVKTAQIHSWWYEENCQDWCCPENLRPSTSLHCSGKWTISTIVLIADIVHQALAKIICSHAAIVHCCKTSMDSIYWFQT
jgi:hypothetical protein